MFVPCRLNKFLREATGLSARGVERLWDQGAVRHYATGDFGDAESLAIEGNQTTTVLGLDRLVFQGDVVTVEGRAVMPRRTHHTLVFNKPRSVTSTVHDPKGKRDLSAYMATMPSGVFPVGRLDRDTTGLLLFTTDGDLCSAMLRPEHHTDKLYWLWVASPLSDSDPRLLGLTDGVEIASGWARAKRVVVQHRNVDYAELLVTLDEGRNRQIRRMCRALDLHLLHLHRKRVGPIGLDGLEQGAWRELGAGEVKELWESAGGRARVVARRTAALERQARALRAAGQGCPRLEAWLSLAGG
jgi:23S rRNA pseudouridine2605 synthase